MADSALPVGTYVHSFGLETYIQEGRVRDGETLKKLLTAELHLRVRSCDLPLLGECYNCAMKEDLMGIKKADDKITSLKHPRETRETSAQMGRSLLNLYLSVSPSALLRKAASTFQPGRGHYLTVFACVSASLGLEPSDMISAYLYGYLTSRISTAVRLIPLGQTEGQSLLLSFFPLCESISAQLSDRPGSVSDFSGMADIQMMRHEKLETRIFKS